MTPGVKPLIAGNWKMNGLRRSLNELDAMAQGYDAGMHGKLDLLICVPSTLLFSAAQALSGNSIALGGQDCHTNISGAHTGDISAEMLADCGADFTIVGHSERRTDHAESNETVKIKAEAALAAGLGAIVCIGETQQQREAGETLSVLGDQLTHSLPKGAHSANTIIAYEPVWAIGTGLVPSVEDVSDAHEFLRGKLKEQLASEGETMRILYGGSVKPSNAGELLSAPNVDGALVGGASLKAEDFLGIAKATAKLEPV